MFVCMCVRVSVRVFVRALPIIWQDASGSPHVLFHSLCVDIKMTPKIDN